jgi:hypothetical protein
MIALFCLCVALFVSPFKSKSRLEAENAALRHQLIILRRKVRGRIRLQPLAWAQTWTTCARSLQHRQLTAKRNQFQHKVTALNRARTQLIH